MTLKTFMGRKCFFATSRTLPASLSASFHFSSVLLPLRFQEMLLDAKPRTGINSNVR